MAQQNRTVLKSYFETGDTPTQAQFTDFIDSVLNYSDDGTPFDYNNLTNTPDLSVYAEKTNVLELDNTATFTPDADYEPATKKYVDDNSGGGGGGHTYQENGVAVTQRAARNIITNGSKNVLVDDPTNDETDEIWYFEVCADLDPIGKQDGDAWAYNSTSGKTEPVSTAPFDNILNSSEANISANGQLSTILPAGYKIDTITVSETSSNAAGSISIGTAALATQIVNAYTVSADEDSEMTLVASGQYQSRTTDTDLYVSSSSWGSGVITIYFTFKKV